jgi:hypothetical protein
VTLTTEQIAIIEQIVDAKLAARLQSTRSTAAPKRWHTTPEIRQLILQELPSLIEWFGNDEFDIAVLRHFLARKTTMRDGDLEIPNSDHQNVTRWDSQVLTAINTSMWPECPIVPTNKRRHYRIYQPQQLSL